MRAIRIDRFGGPEVLRIVDTVDVEPRSDEALVRTIATSINPVDDKTRGGVIGEGTPALPMTLGWDLAGIVVDGGASGLHAGARVIAMSHQLDTGRGTWADLVALPVCSLAPAPRAVSLVEAATLPLPGLIALQTLNWLEISAGKLLLVTGATGAVGGLAVQIARARGARVDALVSRTEHTVLAERYGAEFVATNPKAFGGRGYDAVFDTYGALATKAIADGGRYASIATQAGPAPDLTYRGVQTIVNQVREDGAGLAELTRLVDAGALKLRVDSTFGLHAIQDAHARYKQGHLNGKIAIIL
ncbi:Alcohol dehydrogenase GroES domain protein [Parafrankia sp. EAN1pec]|uniref:NADP-dependent oxidoreductase n=1 Tax=Parafrankia sp. (strain EAN1pec) TaxID=298653 RepID=UPI00005437AE|nr:Alcohol dehydrogenase GroES domain protein [Frankia sp. EAN1pec]